MTVVGLGALASAGLVAGSSWALRARSPAAVVAPAHATAIAGWAGLTTVAAGVCLVTGDPVHPAGLAALLAAALAAAVGVAGAARLATLDPGLAHAGAEAALVGASCVSILWVVAGSPSAPSGEALAALTLTTIDLVSAALLVRLPLAPGVRAPAPVRRPQFVVGLTAIAALAVADGALTLRLLGMAVPADAGPAVRTGACLLAAALPWLGRGAPDEPRRPSAVARALPYVLVAAAVGAQLVAAFSAPVGPVSIVLVALVVSALSVVQGLARRENAELVRDLRTSRTHLAALVENAGDVILALDTAGRVRSANRAAQRVLRRAPEAMNGLDVAELAVPADRPAVRAVVDPVAAGLTGAGRVELRLTAPARGTAELRLRSVAGGAVANLSDVTEAVRLRDRLDRLARFDELTGLAKRGHLLDEIGAWQCSGGSVTVLYTDLDGFKAVNDRFGHRRGDEVLVEASRRLRQVVDAAPARRALLARIGGDEFVAAFADLRAGSLSDVADRLLAAMRPAFDVAGRAVRVGVSIGVATTGDPGAGGPPPGDPGDLLHRADVAMFAAKQAGRFRALRWDPVMETRVLRSPAAATGLRRALDERRLGLAFQPLVRLTDGAVLGAEALVRLPAGLPGLAGLPEIVTPAELAAVAEDAGEATALTEFGDWVLGEATAQAGRWLAAGHDVHVALDVTVRQLTAAFPTVVRRALETAGLPPRRLVVELAGESPAAGPGQDPVRDVVERLRRLGVVLVLDGFGAGHRALDQLRHLPLSGIKLDRSLVAGIDADDRARALVRAVVAAARTLGVTVGADGVETAGAARAARDLGVRTGQGTALSAPLPPDAVAQFLRGTPPPFGPVDLT